MAAAIFGLVLGLVIGAGCRFFDIPSPAPPRLIGACLLLAMTVGFIVADHELLHRMLLLANSSALVLPLYGDLTPAEQDLAIAPADRPKIILATNIAESSITIDGVNSVIDSGLARIASDSPWTGMPRRQESMPYIAGSRGQVVAHRFRAAHGVE